MGISHRRLKGWEPREVTDVFEDGKLIRRTVTRREPEFTPRELNKLLASVELEHDLNPHGIPYAEAIDPANKNAFVADAIPTIDWAEKAIGDARDAYYKEWPGVSTNGHLWMVRRRSAAKP